MRIIFDDLPWQLFIAAFVFQLRARDHAVRSAENLRINLQFFKQLAQTHTIVFMNILGLDPTDLLFEMKNPGTNKL